MNLVALRYSFRSRCGGVKRACHRDETLAKEALLEASGDIGSVESFGNIESRRLISLHSEYYIFNSCLWNKYVG